MEDKKQKIIQEILNSSPKEGEAIVRVGNQSWKTRVIILYKGPIQENKTER